LIYIRYFSQSCQTSLKNEITVLKEKNFVIDASEVQKNIDVADDITEKAYSNPCESVEVAVAEVEVDVCVKELEENIEKDCASCDLQKTEERVTVVVADVQLECVDETNVSIVSTAPVQENEAVESKIKTSIKIETQKISDQSSVACEKVSEVEKAELPKCELVVEKKRSRKV